MAKPNLNFSKYKASEYKVHNKIAFFCGIGLMIFILPKIIGVFYPIIRNYDLYIYLETIIISIIGSILATSIVFRLLYGLDRDNNGLLELRETITNAMISDVLSVKHHVFMLRITSHPLVDECEGKVSEYIRNGEQWDWHICLADVEGYTDVKYNNFSNLLNLFFQKNIATNLLEVKPELQSTELVLVDYEKFQNEIFETHFYPMITSIFGEQKLIENIKDFHSIIITGIISYDKAESEGMPRFEKLIDFSEVENEKLQINRVIFNTPKTRNNHLFKNRAADFLGKLLIRNLSKCTIIKTSEGEEMRLHIAKNVTEPKMKSEVIDQIYKTLNT